MYIFYIQYSLAKIMNFALFCFEIIDSSEKSNML